MKESSTTKNITHNDLSLTLNPIDKCDNDDTDSVDEALMEMLGITSFETKEITNNEDNEFKTAEKQQQYPIISNEELQDIIDSSKLRDFYDKESICIFPQELSIPSQTMRRFTDELIYGSDKYKADRTNETIKFLKNGEIGSRRVLTRLENFVSNHSGWRDLCYNYITSCISAVMGEEMVLFKEKLNLKPPGGSGFAPHLDTPSLRVALGNQGPKTFVTVMVAIDDMSVSNGCLKVSKGPWSEQNHCEIIIPDKDDTNPDAEGRRGAIPSDVADLQEYDDIVIKSGTIAAFNGWAPHRSTANTSPFPRRAIFLTYNPLNEGDFRDMYYQKMRMLRSSYRNRCLGASTTKNTPYEIDENELAALATIPRI